MIYYVAGKEKTLLLDTRPQSVHSADIGYDAKNRVVYVLTFFTNTVVADELRQSAWPETIQGRLLHRAVCANRGINRCRERPPAS